MLRAEALSLTWCIPDIPNSSQTQTPQSEQNCSPALGRVSHIFAIYFAQTTRVPKIWTAFKIVYDLPSARSSSPCTSSPFPLSRQPVWKLPAQTGTTRPSKQYSPVQKAVPLHEFIFYITSGEQKKIVKKGDGEDCS